MKNFIFTMGLSVVLLLSSSCNIGPPEPLQKPISLVSLEPANESLEPILQASQSVFLTYTRVYVTLPDGQTTESIGYGSCFLYEDQRTIISARHVFYPELFNTKIAIYMAMPGARLTKDILLWSQGTVYLDSNNSLNISNSLRLGTDFELLRIPELSLVSRTARIKINDTWENISYKTHTVDHTDFAYARLNKKSQIRGLTLRNPTNREKGRKVYMVGYPFGRLGLDTNIVDTEVSVVFIRKVSLMVRVGGPVMGGFSGCPIIDSDGRVLGVVSYRWQYVVGYAVPAKTLIDNLR
jgi:hypothetical protein